jgi:hypothetical protein
MPEGEGIIKIRMGQVRESSTSLISIMLLLASFYMA